MKPIPLSDPKAIVAIITTLALAACLVILVLKGDMTSAFTFGALLAPSTAQLITHAVVPPAADPPLTTKSIESLTVTEKAGHT